MLLQTTQSGAGIWSGNTASLFTAFERKIYLPFCIKYWIGKKSDRQKVWDVFFFLAELGLFWSDVVMHRVVAHCFFSIVFFSYSFSFHRDPCALRPSTRYFW